MKLYVMLLSVLVVGAAVTYADIVIPGPHQLPDPNTTPPDTTKPVKVFIMSGQSNMVGFGRIAGTELGTLETITGAGMFPHLVDDSTGAWTVRNDVRYRGVISAIGNDLLTPKFGANTSHFGPELGFGHIMGYVYDEPVLLIKTSIGNRSLGWDCLPPGSESFVYNGTNYAGYGDYGNWPVGDDPPTTGGWYAGKQYDDYFLDEADMGPRDWVDNNPYTSGCQVRNAGIVYNCKAEHTSSAYSEPGVGAQWSTYWNIHSVFNVTDILDNFAAEYPDYAAQGFEIAGYVWWQGHKDQGEPHASNYEQNMVNFIKELRNYYSKRYPDNCSPNAPFVLATIAFGGWDLAGAGLTVANGQLAVSEETGNYPEFERSVKTVEARGFWRDGSISPTTTGYHYNHNAETYMLVGDALGRAMVDLLPAYQLNAGNDMISWSGASIDLDATVQEGVTVTSYTWSAISSDPTMAVTFDPPVNPADPNMSNVEDPTVTITKGPGDASDVLLNRKVEDGVNPPVIDVVRIEVHDDACKATRLGLGQVDPIDLVEDCIINLDDMAALVTTWLDDNSLTTPVTK